MTKLLIVEDDLVHEREIRNVAESAGFHCSRASTRLEAVEAWTREGASFAVIVLDIALGREKDGGWTFLKEIRNKGTNKICPVIIYSAAIGGARAPLEALMSHRFQVVEKGDIAQLGATLAKLAEECTPRSAAIELSPQEVAELDILADTNLPVLLVGPSGSGKSTKARLLAERSGCPAERILHLNCAYLSSEFAISELFGHMKGAYTDAKVNRIGLMMIASGYDPRVLEAKPSLAESQSPKGEPAFASSQHRWGAVILDEIGTLSREVQGKLLSVLDGEPIRPLGWSGMGFLPNFRIIAATNEESLLLDETRFRRDLLLRINAWVIRCVGLSEIPRAGFDSVLKNARIEIREKGSPGATANISLCEEAVDCLWEGRHSVQGGYRELNWILQKAWVIAQIRNKDIVGSDATVTTDNVREALSATLRPREQFTLSGEVSDDPFVTAVRDAVALVVGVDSARLTWKALVGKVKDSDADARRDMRAKLDEIIKSSDLHATPEQYWLRFAAAIRYKDRNDLTPSVRADRAANAYSKLFPRYET